MALRTRPIRLPEAVENVGLDALRAPHVKHLEGKLRASGQGGIARGVYMTAAGRRWWFRMSRKTPHRALAAARERMRQVTS